MLTQVTDVFDVFEPGAICHVVQNSKKGSRIKQKRTPTWSPLEKRIEKESLDLDMCSLDLQGTVLIL